MQIEHYVTPWGFPGLRWWDTISNMTGNPLTDNMPAIKSHQVERRLWINYNGVQVLALDEGKPAVAGHWDEWDSLVMASTRIDLSPNDAVLMQKNRFRWVEHQIIEAHFKDGTVNRIAQSAVPEVEMRRLHEAVSKTFIEQRPGRRFEPPAEGRCLPEESVIEAVIEPLERGEANKTRTNVSPEECRKMGVWHELPVPSVEWSEPVMTKGLLWGHKHHLVQRLMYVGRGFREGRRSLSFNTYRPDGNVIAVHADFALLEGFRLVESRQVKFPKLYQPMQDMEPGWTIVADFRYGYSIPLTCTTHDPEKVETLRRFFVDKVFMPLVGKRLSDEDLGLPPKRSGR